jgi:hypothetical protein
MSLNEFIKLMIISLSSGWSQSLLTTREFCANHTVPWQGPGELQANRRVAGHQA